MPLGSNIHQIGLTGTRRISLTVETSVCSSPPQSKEIIVLARDATWQCLSKASIAGQVKMWQPLPPPSRVIIVPLCLSVKRVHMRLRVLDSQLDAIVWPQFDHDSSTNTLKRVGWWLQRLNEIWGCMLLVSRSVDGLCKYVERRYLAWLGFCIGSRLSCCIQDGISLHFSSFFGHWIDWPPRLTSVITVFLGKISFMSPCWSCTGHFLSIGSQSGRVATIDRCHIDTCAELSIKHWTVKGFGT